MRDVLVAVCGLTPQVVTETLWALHHCAPPVDPAELWILTTDAGRDVCQRNLFGPQGAIASYLREYGRPPASLSYGPDRLIVLKGADGAPLDDVRTEPDNRAVADQIADFIRRQTDRPDIRLHCSVAGGRKTMGVLLAGALQLFGRAEDRLYHVLVPPEIESHPDFFYPPKRARTLTLRDGRRLDARTATIELAELPYVRLRGLLPAEILTRAVSLSGLTETAQRRLQLLVNPEPVRFHPKDNVLLIGTNRAKLQPAGMTIYRALARTKLHHCARRDLPTCGDCMECFLPFTKDTWERTKAILEERGHGRLLPSVRGPDDAPGQFLSLVSKLNKALDHAAHLSGSENPYRVRSGGPKGGTVYGLALDKTKLSEG